MNQESTQNPNLGTQPSLKRTNQGSNNIRDPLKVDQSFLESFETTSVLGSSNINTPLVPLHDRKAAVSETTRTQNHILSNGATIRDQQQDNKRLETENYNLKIKLATFTRFFDLSPEDQRKLLTENVDLKQQLMEKVHEIDRLHSQIDRANEDKENTLVSAASALPIPNISLILAEKDDNIRRLNSIIHTNKDELDALRSQVANISAQGKSTDELFEKLERLENDNQRLRRQLQALQDQLAQSQRGEDVSADELNVLRRNMHEAQNEAVIWKEKFDSLSAKLEDDANTKFSQVEMERAWHEVEQAQKAYQSMRSELEQTQLRLQAVQRESSKANNESETVHGEVSSLKSHITHLEAKLSSLQSSLASKQSDVNHLQLEHDGDKQSLSRLQSRLETLNEDLKEKEKQEHAFKKQISALINERDNKSNDSRAFQHQYEAMKDREQVLTERNQELKLELEKLKDQIFQEKSRYSSNDERLSEAYDEIKELKDKLDFFESEYEKLEDELHNSELSMSNLRNELNKNQFSYSDMKDNNDYLKQRLDSSENTIKELKNTIQDLKIQSSTKPEVSALEQLNKYNAQRLEDEKIELLDEIDTLKYELSRVRLELNQQKSFKLNPSRDNDAFELRRLNSEKHLLQTRLESKEYEVSDLESKCRKLTLEIGDKEAAIESLEKMVRDTTRNKKLDVFVEDEERTGFLKERASSDSQIRVLRLQNETLQKELDSQIAYYKSKLDELMRVYNKRNGSESAISSSVVALLEEQVDEAQKTKHELTFKLAEANSRIEEFQLTSQAEQETSASMSVQNKQLTEINAALESSESILKVENRQLQEKAKRLTEETERVTKHCEKLASKLKELKGRELERDDSVYQRLLRSVEEISKYKTSNKTMQRKIEELSEQLDASKLDSSRKTRTQFDLLQNELQYYRAKLYDMNLHANDLSLVNFYVDKAIKNSDLDIKNQVAKLTSVGGYAKVQQEPRKLTFAVVAKFVLASVRIKRRLERSNKRLDRLLELRTQIEKQRYFV